MNGGGGGGGTTNYNALNNLPQINGITLKGNKSLSDLGIEQIQVSTMPEASASLVGKIVQFTGTTGTYTNGYFYKCVENDGVYSWEASNTQEEQTLPTFNSDDFDEVGGEVSLTPEQRIFTGTQDEWDDLTAEEKALYGIVNITDDDSNLVGHVYSTSEQRVGTWIDGKPLYEKSFQITNPTTSADGTITYAVTAIGSLVDNGWVETAFLADGYVGGASNKPLPLISSSGISHRTAVEVGTNHSDNVSYRNSVVVYNSKVAWSGIPIYVTIRYTKTTD